MGTFSWIVLAVVVGYLVFTTFRRYRMVKNYDPANDSNKILLLKDANFKEKTARGVVLVDFWAPWCAPCKMLAPVISELAEEFDSKASIAKLNVDENKAIATEFGIRSIPTVVIFNDGKAVKQIMGLKSINTYRKAINELL